MAPIKHFVRCGNCSLEMWNVIGKPENMGWWQVLQALNKSSQDYSGKVTLIVDSDLENHENSIPEKFDTT